MYDDDQPVESDNFIIKTFNRAKVSHQKLLDRSTPHVKYRWIGFTTLMALFITRILYAQAWYIICYALGIYLLNLFLAFLQPKFDPSVEQELRDESIEAGEMTAEFKPFIRRLSEFKFWYRATVATSLSLFLTSTSWTDIPVFWPILVVYFFILFTLTMRKQIQHMIKYRYIPLDIGKKKYGTK